MEFVDRIAQHPGRVKLVKVSDSTDLYDLIRAEDETSEGTPLNAATLNAMLKEINDNIALAKLNSLKISDGTYYGSAAEIGDNRDIVIRLPSTITANIKGSATSATTATELSSNYGSVTVKTVSLSTSYTTIYSAETYASALVIIAPWNAPAKNTAIFAISHSSGSTSTNDVTYVNKSGYIKKQWSGSNFQVAMSSSDAAGTYSVTIVDAHY